MIKKLFKNKTSVLFILLVLSCTILPMTYSRYIATEYGIVQTEVAKWDITYSGSSNKNLELVAKNATQADYTFTITSLSETSSVYSLEISNVPSDITVKIDNVSYTPVGGKVTINQLGTFEYDSVNTSKTHTISLISNSNTNAQNVQLNIKVDVKQLLGGA